MRLNSSKPVLRRQRRQIRRKVSAAGLLRAVRPALVSASLLPCGSARLAACTSNGERMP